jgi:hypothetical protein
MIWPLFSLLFKALLGQLLTQGGSLQSIQAKAKLPAGSRLTTRIRENDGLMLLAFFAEHANSQIRHPKHFSGSHIISLSILFNL